MNWTSTNVPLWQSDCENFWRAGGPFEVRGVSSDEHKAFIALFAERHSLNFSQSGTTVSFEAGDFGLPANYRAVPEPNRAARPT